jgi:proline iminopeptidase
MDMHGGSTRIFRAALVAAALAGVLACPRVVGQTPIAPGEHNVVLNGVRLWYKVSGSPRAGQAPLLYLHGGPGYNSYSFEKTIGARLEAHALVIYLDERGSGRSERPWDNNYQMSTLVADVEALRASLGVESLIPMGHSFGGSIALEYAARYPQHVQRLIIVDGAADIPTSLGEWRSQLEQHFPAAWKRAMASSKGKALRKVIKSADRCAVAKANFAWVMLALSDNESARFHRRQQFHDLRFAAEQDALDGASGLRNTGEIGAAYFSAQSDFLCYRFTAYGELTMPVLVIVGRYDGAIGIEPMRALAKHLRRAQFDEFDLSAHFPYAEQSEKFDRDVAAFLSE